MKDMHLSLASVTKQLPRFFSFFSTHYRVTLFLLFLCALAGAGYVFWVHGYRVVVREPEVTVRPVLLKEEAAEGLVADAQRRKEVREAMQGKTFPDPFVKPELLP